MDSNTPTNPSKPNSPGVPILHHLSSSQSLRILWALEELSAANPAFTYNLKTYTRVKARAPKELQSIHRLGLSPILVIDPPLGSPSGSEGSIVVTESRLILQYLSDHYSDGIWETQIEKDRVRNTFFQEFANTSLAGKAVSVLQFDVIPGHVPFLVRPLASLVFNGIASVLRKDLAKQFQLLEDALAEAAEERKEWFAGEKIGLADFCISWPMDVCEQRGYFDGAAYPKLAEWLRRVHERPAYIQAIAKGGSYDLVSFDWK